MSNPTATSIRDDVGIAYITIVGTTATIVGNLITKAQNDIRDITGTTTGRPQDRAIRALADAYTIQNAMSSLDPSKSNTMYEGMRDDFVRQANDALRTIGKSVDGITVQFQQVNP